MIPADLDHGEDIVRIYRKRVAVARCVKAGASVVAEEPWDLLACIIVQLDTHGPDEVGKYLRVHFEFPYYYTTIGYRCNLRAEHECHALLVYACRASSNVDSMRAASNRSDAELRSIVAKD